MARKQNPDNNYFSKIDDEYKAYLLGFIFADGNIYDGRTKDRPNRQLRLSIYCASYDDYILDKFLEDNPLATKTYNIRKYRTNETKITIVRITNNKLCNDLIKLGCNIKKSQIGMTFPILKTKFIKHFIRGFLDGDGSIIHRINEYKYKRKTSYKLSKVPKKEYHMLRIAFSSTDKLFLDTILNYLPVTKYSYTQKKNKIICYTLWIEDKNNTQKVLEYLYLSSKYYLKRKVLVFKEYYKSISSEAINTFIERSTTT